MPCFRKARGKVLILMSNDDVSPDEVTDATVDAEQDDAQVKPGTDRMPTPEEELLAEEAAEDVNPESAEAYKEMARRGAEVEGEGQIGG